MVSVLVTGANRGIGFGLVRQLVQEPTVSTVFATVRDAKKTENLSTINSPKLHIIELEVINEKSIEAAVAKVSSIVGDNGLDFLINNAGIFNNFRLDDPIKKDFIMQQFEVNTVAPLMVANKFLDLLKKASVKNGKAQVANISSGLGSLEMTPQMSSSPMPTAIYSMSKAALNMFTRKVACEWKKDNIRATSFCPGWVKTDMGTAAAMLELDQSTVPLAKLILGLTEENNGLYYKYDGEAIPW